MSNKQEFSWRPNDNSVSTRLKYSLEAEHWTRAFQSAQINVGRGNSNLTVQLILLLFTLILQIIYFVYYLMVHLFRLISDRYAKYKFAKDNRAKIINKIELNDHDKHLNSLDEDEYDDYLTDFFNQPEETEINLYSNDWDNFQQRR